MRDRRGRLIRLGDRVRIGGDISGVVVFSLDTGEFGAGFPEAEWRYLARGIMLRTERAGLVHLPESDEDTLILPRAAQARRAARPRRKSAKTR